MKSRVIHVVDDEAPVRASLAFLLMSAGYAVQAHEGGRAFLDALGDPANACLVTDLRMPDMDGLELLRALAERGLSVPTIVITGHGDVQMAVAAMKAGAIDFIEKPFEDAVLIDAVRRADADARSQAPAPYDIQHRVAQLTPREKEILSRVVSGLANKNIAYDLQISPRTVEVHRANIMHKMRAHSLPELVRMTLAMDLKAF